MKKWQKIVGIFTIAVLGIVNFIIYAMSDINVMYLKGPIDPILIKCRQSISNMGYLILANYLIIIFLFICLWRKGGKK